MVKKKFGGKSDRYKLFCGTQDGRVKVWNASAEKLLADIKIDSETPR